MPGYPHIRLIGGSRKGRCYWAAQPSCAPMSKQQTQGIKDIRLGSRVLGLRFGMLGACVAFRQASQNC